MHKTLYILLCLMSLPSAAAQTFLWLTDSTQHQEPKKYRKALDVNGVTLPLLMENVASYIAKPIQATNDRAMSLLKTEASACTGNRVKTAERQTFSYITSTPHTVFPGLRLYSKTNTQTTIWLQQQLNKNNKINLQQLLAGDNKLNFAIGGGRSYGDTLDPLLQNPQWQHKFWQRRSTDMSAGLIDMLVQNRVDLLIEYPNVIQHYVAQLQKKTDLTSFAIEESTPYMLGYILCSKTAEGQRLVKFFEQRLQLISKDKRYFQAHLGWVDQIDRAELTTLYNQIYGTKF
jgi:uncharacterized protein (TIGR02285 family)